MTARTDRVKSIAEARHVQVARVCPPDNPRKALAATGHLSTFRCTFAEIGEDSDGVTLDPMAAAALDVCEGDMIWHVER